MLIRRSSTARTTPRSGYAAVGRNGRDVWRLGPVVLGTGVRHEPPIESARIAINRHVGRGGKVWINIYPDRPLNKGQPKPGWVPVRFARVVGRQRGKPGRVMFELTYPGRDRRRKH